MKIFLRLHNYSLTARLLFFFATISLLAWIIATLIAVHTSTKYIKTFFDTQQILMAKTLLTVPFAAGNIELPPTEMLLPKDSRKKLKREDNDAIGFALFSVEGEVLLTDGEHGNDFPFLPHEKNFSKVEVDDDEWRILWLHSADTKRIAAVGQEMEYRTDMILHILWGQLSPWIVTLPFLLLGFGFALYRELRPLRNIAKDLTARKAYDTSPLVSDNIPQEIQPLLKALNTLFERIGILLVNERAFVSNAAHELRTPLTGLKIQAEVMAMSEDDPKAQKQALQKILQATNKCSHLIDQLLLLSQLESNFYSKDDPNQHKDILGPINWEELVKEACLEAQDYACSKSINLSYTAYATPSMQVGMASLWAIALRNLIDNAIRYSPEGQNVHIYMHADKICISNDGINIDESILPQLGKRFYRPAGQKALGSGLGLAIVNHIVAMHDAKFSINNERSDKDGVAACILL